jgi:hypothetical protein
MELVDDQHCFVCGKKNAAGLQLDFELVGGQNSFKGSGTLSTEVSSPPSSMK